MVKKIFPKRIEGSIRIPTSKSHTIRGLVIAMLADGTSVLKYPLYSRDTLACLKICRQFGTKIKEHDNEWIIEGTNGKLITPDNIVNVQNSGTTLYITMGNAALCDEFTVFTGDSQIIKRPVTPLINALNTLCEQAFTTRNSGTPPLLIKGPLYGGTVEIDCSSTSQYLTSLLINTPLAKNDTTIRVPHLNEKPFIDITLDWLNRQDIELNYNKDYSFFKVKGNQSYKAFTKTIPGDFSSAAFFLCAAAICGTKISIEGLDKDDSQGDKNILSILEKMGCQVFWEKDSVILIGPNPENQIKRLKGIKMDLNAMPDAVPVLAVTSCYAEGETQIINVPQARLKETDRIAIMCKELKKMGGKVQERPDGLYIEGSPLFGCRVNGHYDHRVVMSLSIGALKAKGATEIDTAEAAEVTFPTFFSLLSSFGVQVNDIK